MTDLQFTIALVLSFCFAFGSLWLAFRACIATESIANTLANLHAAEIAGMAEVFREEREAAANRFRAGRAQRPLEDVAKPGPDPIRARRFGASRVE